MTHLLAREYFLSRYLILVVALIINLTSCTREPEGIGQAVPWSKLRGWENDKHAEAWPALTQSCIKTTRRSALWKKICFAAKAISTPTNKQARLFFERWFQPHQVINGRNSTDGLITGYFEPLLSGSMIKTDRFQYPLYKRPKNLLKINLSSVYPKLKGMRLRGRLQGNNVVPFYSRAEIESNRSLLKGAELVWVDDPIALFFLQIQGSGKVKLENGKMLAVGYSGQNGHPYVPIGRKLVELGEIKRKSVSLKTIRQWLITHQQRQDEIFNSNPSYVFFKVRENGPFGSLDVPLTPQRSIAVHRKFIRLGIPVWLDTTLPTESLSSTLTPTKYQRLMFAQDTGGAIRGAVRADVFWGAGKNARFMAGHMKQDGRLFVLLPKDPSN